MSWILVRNGSVGKIVELEGLTTSRATSSHHSNLLSVGMHGDAIAVVVFVFLMIMNGFSASGLPDEALVRGR